MNGVDKQKHKDVLLIQIKRRKRSAKTKVTKLRHELERLCVKDSEVTDIESMIEQFWAALEHAQEVLEELFAFYIEVEDNGEMKLLRVRNHRKRRTKSDRSGAKCDRIPRMQSHEYEHAINREHDGSLRAIGPRRSAKRESPQPQGPKPIFEAFKSSDI